MQQLPASEEVGPKGRSQPIAIKELESIHPISIEDFSGLDTCKWPLFRKKHDVDTEASSLRTSREENEETRISQAMIKVKQNLAPIFPLPHDLEAAIPKTKAIAMDSITQAKKSHSQTIISVVVLGWFNCSRYPPINRLLGLEEDILPNDQTFEMPTNFIILPKALASTNPVFGVKVYIFPRSEVVDACNKYAADMNTTRDLDPTCKLSHDKRFPSAWRFALALQKALSGGRKRKRGDNLAIETALTEHRDSSKQHPFTTACLDWYDGAFLRLSRGKRDHFHSSLNVHYIELHFDSVKEMTEGLETYRTKAGHYSVMTKSINIGLQSRILPEGLQMTDFPTSKEDERIRCDTNHHFFKRANAILICEDVELPRYILPYGVEKVVERLGTSRVHLVSTAIERWEDIFPPPKKNAIVEKPSDDNDETSGEKDIKSSDIEPHTRNESHNEEDVLSIIDELRTRSRAEITNLEIAQQTCPWGDSTLYERLHNHHQYLTYLDRQQKSENVKKMCREVFLKLWKDLYNDKEGQSINQHFVSPENHEQACKGYLAGQAPFLDVETTGIPRLRRAMFELADEVETQQRNIRVLDAGGD